jgi:hypothetical protein
VRSVARSKVTHLLSAATTDLMPPLQLSDVKPLVVGHWGTTPGQNFIDSPNTAGIPPAARTARDRCGELDDAANSDAPDAVVTRQVRWPGPIVLKGSERDAPASTQPRRETTNFCAYPIDWSHYVRCYGQRTVSPFCPAG